MANQKAELQSTELFEELSDADLMTVVGGIGLGAVVEGAQTIVTNTTNGLSNTTTGTTQDSIANIPSGAVNGFNNTVVGITSDLFSLV